MMLAAGCAEQPDGFAPEHQDLLIEFPTLNQEVGTNAQGVTVFRLSGTISNISEGSADLPELRVVARDRKDGLIFAKNIALAKPALKAGETLQVEQAIVVPDDARIFDIGWAGGDASS
ncbi:hypothetical protein [Altererythrobacter lutimaris]|nr:hypothetical protein [Altererythrobacter lutimaris]